MDHNSDWVQWSHHNRQQQPFVRVSPRIADAINDVWIDRQQAEQVAEHFGVHAFERRSGATSATDVHAVGANNTPAWLDEIMRELSAASTGKQIAVGSFSGWCSGYLLGRVGKAAALAVGGSLIILQIAHYQGLVQINWNRVQRSVESTQRKFGQHVTNSNISVIMNTVWQFGRRHVFLAGSFGAGFLIGLAM